jgi:hypothetical protein
MNIQTKTNQPFQMSSNHPTSPWTEAYHACTANQSEPTTGSALAQRSEDAETQKPTHDALSAIYNQGY